MMLDSTANRRDILRILAGCAALAAGARPAFAVESRIGRLIGEARALPIIAQRIDFISRALLGSPYRSHTLIGGPNKAEEMVTRDDAFDCVTYCETVLAAAMVREPVEFEASLRQIRYHDGAVDWRGRNHYFSEWSEHNVANHICLRVALPGSMTIDRTVNWMPELGRRQVALAAIPRAALLANTQKVATGDIIGFVSERPKLDYFHIGFVVVGRDGKMLVRHAAQSKHRVLDERMDRFLAVNRVRRVTLLRPAEPQVDIMNVNL